MPERQLRNRSTTIGVVAGLGGLAAIFVTLFAAGYLPLDIFGQRPTAVELEKIEPIIAGKIDVLSAGYEYIQFEVPADARIPIVRGSFLVTDGTPRDIIVMILDEDDFAKKKVGETPAFPHYFSTKVITADIGQKVPSGTLYLVFDNTYSLGSAKSVEADIQLAYLE